MGSVQREFIHFKVKLKFCPLLNLGIFMGFGSDFHVTKILNTIQKMAFLYRIREQNTRDGFDEDSR